MQTPDITPAQILAVVGAVVAVAVAFGVHLTNDQRLAILALAGVLAPTIVWVDMHIRKNRANNLGAIQASKTAHPTKAPPAKP